MNHFLSTRTILFLSIAGITTIGVMGLGCGGEKGFDEQPKSISHQSVSGLDPTGNNQNKRDPFDPFVAGNNTCFMVQAYFPTDALNKLLPKKLSIPDAAKMAALYPDTELLPDAHPFMLSFCHGSNIHDVITERTVPEQEEIMFLFPVIYTHDKGEEYLCSYIPVLYLDSFSGVVGGLYYGLRKQFHPKMEHETTPTSRSWRVENIFDASFEMLADTDLATVLPRFFAQTFSNPFVTVSYPMPLPRMVFYQAKVFPDTVKLATENFFWTYKGTTIEESDNTWSIYSEYEFTMSKPMNAKKYFGK